MLLHNSKRFEECGIFLLALLSFKFCGFMYQEKENMYLYNYSFL